MDFEVMTEEVADRMRHIRDDLHPFRPTLHVFLGNALSNIREGIIGPILSSTSYPSDLFVTEYANYTADELADLNEDYASLMAKRAAAELFSVADDMVCAKTVSKAGGKCVEITVRLKEQQDLCFYSMLRRRFRKDELTDRCFEFIGTTTTIKDVISMDVYRRSASAVAVM